MRRGIAGRLPPGFFTSGQTPAEERQVARVVSAVRREGNRAVRRFTRQFDGVDQAVAPVSPEQIERALTGMAPELRAALERSIGTLRRFARRQLRGHQSFLLELAPGVVAGQRMAPLSRVGIYVPGGRAPLLSSLLMAAVPAQVAGVASLAVCSPPGRDGGVAPSILAAAGLLGIGEVYPIGGAQAVAAMAWGTESVPRGDQIVGPGNRYVTQAKKRVAGDVGIDGLAGPSEVVVIADHQADPRLVAADLLAQAEHDPQARAVVLSDSPELLGQVARRISRELRGLPAGAPVRAALRRHGWLVGCSSLAEAVELANRLAPEHLELQVADPHPWLSRLRHFGSLFIGPWAAEVFGDYSAGINHILPTGGTARFAAGLSVHDFVRPQTTLEVTCAGVKALAPAAIRLAGEEGLPFHRRAAELRRAQACLRLGTRLADEGVARD